MIQQKTMYQYTYDANGNIATSVEKSSCYTYN